MAALATIGRKMVNQDNRATACPLYIVGGDTYPSVYLSNREAERWSERRAEEMGVRYVPRVASAHDNPEMQAVMMACLQAAGKTEHAQAKNAYHHCLFNF
jgi:hypothetical protein